ncbi:MAG: Gfo/Idh/MocA family oxidoreductase [Sedimentisphaerales bacterium]|nr:Gfo/Idh/MocA family oxidoreductase [Sedimentisphaerales bacterium]
MQKIDRRTLIAGAAAGAALTIVPRNVLGGPANTPPSEKLNIAGIGIGGMGRANLKNLSSQNIVALCDVDFDYAAPTFAEYPGARRYKDFRRMLADEKDLDAVMIATPDHTHAIIAMAAIKAGKHVYCQKPLTRDICETRKLTAAAAKAGVTTQMGIQGHSGEGIRLVCEWIRDGAIGQVRAVDAWCTLSYYPWGHAYWSTSCPERPKETPPVPGTLDWDLWIGPAPHRPYHPCYHPGVWRAWWDFGCGMMGDRGAHTLDPVYLALELDAPTSVEATTLEGRGETHPLAAIVNYKFPARRDMPPVKLTWYEGLQAPRPPELEDGRVMANPEGGAIFIGDKGKLMCGVYGESPRLIPETKMKAYKLPEKTIPRVTTSHEMDWVNAAKAGKQPGASFDYSGPLNEMVLLGNVAKKFQARIDWDSENMRVTNIAQANEYICRPYRQGWNL